jgi:hypothetical protein
MSSDEPAPASAAVRKPIPESLLFPEYAIGQKLITRAEYTAIRDEYYTQSQASFGVILPLLFLAYALARSGVAAVGGWVYAAIAAAAVVAFIAGADRLHKYYSELQALIISRYRAAQDAKAAAAARVAVPKDAPAVVAVLAELRKEVAALRAEMARTSPVTIYTQPPREERDTGAPGGRP